MIEAECVAVKEAEIPPCETWVLMQYNGKYWNLYAHERTEEAIDKAAGLCAENHFTSPVRKFRLSDQPAPSGETQRESHLTCYFCQKEKMWCYNICEGCHAKHSAPSPAGEDGAVEISAFDIQEVIKKYGGEIIEHRRGVIGALTSLYNEAFRCGVASKQPVVSPSPAVDEAATIKRIVEEWVDDDDDGFAVERAVKKAFRCGAYAERLRIFLAQAEDSKREPAKELIMVPTNGDPEYAVPNSAAQPAPSPPAMTTGRDFNDDPLNNILAKCEQYWNLSGMCDAEFHAALEFIHREASNLDARYRSQKPAPLDDDGFPVCNPKCGNKFCRCNKPAEPNMETCCPRCEISIDGKVYPCSECEPPKPAEQCDCTGGEFCKRCLGEPEFPPWNKCCKCGCAVIVGGITQKTLTFDHIGEDGFTYFRCEDCEVPDKPAEQGAAKGEGT